MFKNYLQGSEMFLGELSRSCEIIILDLFFVLILHLIYVKLSVFESVQQIIYPRSATGLRSLKPPAFLLEYITG